LVTSNVLHAAEPPVGFVDVSTRLSESTATHSDTDPQDRPVNSFESTGVTVHAASPPVDVTTSQLPGPPPGPNATHSEGDGHEAPTSETMPLTCTGFHVEEPPVGLVEVKIAPSLGFAPGLVAPNAKHSDGEAHATPSREKPSGLTLLAFHAAAPPVGSVELSTFPAPSIATHSDTDGHATA
jgi:hypothetical protein